MEKYFMNNNYLQSYSPDDSTYHRIDRRERIDRQDAKIAVLNAYVQ